MIGFLTKRQHPLPKHFMSSYHGLLFIDKILVGFMHPVILSAECECIGETHRG